MQKKYQVFVSSTFRDLVDERQDAIRNILDLGHIPAGMELFPASDTDQLEYIKKVIDECDYYLLIMGGRYGSLDSEGVSYTEREYDYAVDSGKTVLAFPHANPGKISLEKSEPNQRMRDNLNDFREKVMTGRLVRQWGSREELEPLVLKALIRAFSDFPRTGWIRGNAAASEDLLQEVNSLRLQNDALAKDNLRLRDSLSPEITGLANGKDKTQLRFKYSVPGQAYSRTAKKDLTWDEIFIAIAQAISVARPSDSISTFLKDYLKEKLGTSESYYIYDSDRAIVKNQMVALGLMETRIANSTDGKPYEWLSLSPMGKKKLSEMLAVKANH